jgi:hypothetical protein
MSPRAFALVAACPQCGAPLRVRYTRQAHQPFVGCSGYPRCTFAAEYDEALQELGQETEALRGALVQARRELALARLHRQPVPAQQHASLDRDLKLLLALAHPDKWQGQPATVLAHEIAISLNGLRARMAVTS